METCVHPGGEFTLPSLDDHHLCLNLGLPVSVERGLDEGPVWHEHIPGGFAGIIPAGQTSWWRHTDTVHHLHLYLSRGLLDRATAQMSPARGGMLLGTNPALFHDPHVEQIALLLRLEMESGAANGSLYAETLSSALSIRLLQRENDQVRLPLFTASAAKLRLELRRAAEYIQDNLASDLPLNAIAREAGLSSYHFARLFTEAFGTSPHQYVIQNRIECAKALITKGVPLGDAAQRVGFSDQSHFTRHFKRLVGVTPRVFARGSGRKILL